MLLEASLPGGVVLKMFYSALWSFEFQDEYFIKSFLFKNKVVAGNVVTP